MKKAPIRGLNKPQTDCSEIQFDLSAPLKDVLNRNKYSVDLLDATAISEVHSVPVKIHVSKSTRGFIAKVKNSFAQEVARVQNIRDENARENILMHILQFCLRNGIKIETSPAYATESSGMSEKLAPEHLTRDKVMILSITVPAELWDEALSHANWLRNRLPSSGIHFYIPLLKWDAKARIQFKLIPECGGEAFAFFDQPADVKEKKLLPRYDAANVIVMGGKQRMIRLYLPETQTIGQMWQADFYLNKTSAFPSVSALLDHIAHQRIIEEDLNKDVEQTKNMLQ